MTSSDSTSGRPVRRAAQAALPGRAISWLTAIRCRASASACTAISAIAVVSYRMPRSGGPSANSRPDGPARRRPGPLRRRRRPGPGPARPGGPARTPSRSRTSGSAARRYIGGRAGAVHQPARVQHGAVIPPGAAARPGRLGARGPGPGQLDSGDPAPVHGQPAGRAQRGDPAGGGGRHPVPVHLPVPGVAAQEHLPVGGGQPLPQGRDLRPEHVQHVLPVAGVAAPPRRGPGGPRRPAGAGRRPGRAGAAGAAGRAGERPGARGAAARAGTPRAPPCAGRRR